MECRIGQEMLRVGLSDKARSGWYRREPREIRRHNVKVKKIGEEGWGRVRWEVEDKGFLTDQRGVEKAGEGEGGSCEG